MFVAILITRDAISMIVRAQETTTGKDIVFFVIVELWLLKKVALAQCSAAQVSIVNCRVDGRGFCTDV
jgi:hypothetical protein